MIKIGNAALIVIDIQGRLAQLMYNKEELFENLQIIVKGSQIFKLPIIWMEQLPEKIGPTIPELSDLMGDIEPIKKSSFSCCDNGDFLDALADCKRSDLLIVGIESHICVYQTSVDLLERGYNVHIITDAVSSRKQANKEIGIGKVAAAGGNLTTVEMVLFELLKNADHKNFSDIIKIVK